MKKRKYLKPITYLVGIVSLIVILQSFMAMQTNSEIYDDASGEIVRQHGAGGKVLSSFTVSEDSRVKKSYFFLCGSDDFETITVQDAAEVEFSATIRSGDAKVIMEHKDSGAITEQVLIRGENKISLESGTYEVYAVGKWFVGRLCLKPFIFPLLGEIRKCNV